MGLIKCPDCGKEISDKATLCIGCGYPIKEELEKTQAPNQDIIQKQKEEELRLRIEEAKRRKAEQEAQDRSQLAKQYYCESCHTQNPVYSKCCKKCGYEFGRANVISKSQTKINEEKESIWGLFTNSSEPLSPNFRGVYRYNFGKKQEVYCPRCHSENCSHYQEQKLVNGKTRYSVNLNPLRPFTHTNKKENTKLVTETKFLCNNCGNIFD